MAIPLSFIIVYSQSGFLAHDMGKLSRSDEDNT
jgi:hypothetical protein